MTLEIEAASPRLAVSGTGRIELTETRDADLTLRFTDTSLDPYARAFEPRLSPFTTAVGSGTLRVIGELANPERLVVDAMFEQLQLRTFDYPLRNAKPIRVLMNNNVVRIDDMRFVGDGTELDVSGTIDMNARRVAGLARGNANLGILQGFYRNIRSSGNARADRAGERLARRADHPGTRDDRRRPAAPFLAAALARGGERQHPVRLAQHQARRADRARGRRPGQLRRPHRPRWLHADRSRADGDRPQHAAAVSRRRALGGRRRSVADGTCDGAGARRNRHRAERRSGRRGSIPAGICSTSAAAADGGTPIVAARADRAARCLRSVSTCASSRRARCASKTTTRTSSRAPISRSAAPTNGRSCSGARRSPAASSSSKGAGIVVTRGTLDFTNPVRIEPTFDIAAETQVRVPRQTYRVTLSASGTMQRLRPVFESDPPLPPGRRGVAAARRRRDRRRTPICARCSART